MKRSTLLMGLGGLVHLASCTAADDNVTRIAVTEENAAGVVALELERFAYAGNQVFELRGLGGDDHVVASVRLTKGTIDGLTTLLPQSDATGSELVLAAGEYTQRSVTRETRLIRVTAPEPLVPFLSVGVVASTLQHEAQIYAKLPTDDVGDREVPHTYSCVGSQLLTTPLAGQCCFSWYKWVPFGSHGYLLDPGNMVFVRNAEVTNATIVERDAYDPCRASPLGGGGSCSGTNCYFGPSGFASATLTTGNNPWVYTFNEQMADGSIEDHCSYAFNSYQSPEFTNVTGTVPAGRGCCVDGTGPCGTGLSKACTSCGGGGAAGQGFWDY